jgi:hypothetical protein
MYMAISVYVMLLGFSKVIITIYLLQYYPFQVVFYHRMELTIQPRDVLL